MLFVLRRHSSQPPLIAVLKILTLAFILTVAGVAGGICWWLLSAQELSAARLSTRIPCHFGKRFIIAAFRPGRELTKTGFSCLSLHRFTRRRSIAWRRT